MPRGLRILHLADSHIGADLPARPRSQRRRRGDDLVASYRRVLEFAREHDVDLVIHAGDVFDRSRPSDAALAAAAGPLLALAAADVPVVIVPGNHERSVLPESLLFSHPNLHVVRSPCTLSFALCGTRVGVVGVPCLRRGAAKGFGQALRETGWEHARADVNVLATHQTFESATCGPAGYRFRSGEDVVERNVVPAAIDYIAAGHIHRHQVLATPCDGGPPVVYAGSPDRITFAERDEPKGAVLVKVDGGRLTYRFLEHAVRPMAVVPLNVSGLARAAIREEALERIAALPAEAVALLRLSGETTRREMRGLGLTQRAREARADVLLTVSSQAVEFVSERWVARPTVARSASPFSMLDAPPGEMVERSRAEWRLLPARCGTYALSDARGRVLYIGKARNVRGRVRTHLVAKRGGNCFGGWTQEIARVEARLAYSELEALLIEAELIRRLRPPFNRQMRSWSRYCYLCAGGDPFEQLAIRREPVRGRACFGPFRSRAVAQDVRDASAAFFGLADCPPEEPVLRRSEPCASSSAARLCQRHFAGLCAGPCAARVSDQEYENRRRERATLLSGRDDAAIAAAERELEQAGGRDDGEAVRRGLARRVRTLRAAFTQAAMLRRAEALRGGLLFLPGPNNARLVALFSADGVYLDVLDKSVETADKLLARSRSGTARPHTGGAERLPKHLTDCLCTAARELRRGRDVYRFVPAEVARRLDADGLLALASRATK
jgi:exonuclease SbcD